jgi:pimeloyl-ACP methyl ester carboxylesterase
MAAKDLPAMLEYVTHTTGAKQVHYIGHSQGTTLGFAGISLTQELAKKVKRFYALAPVARLSNIRDKVLKKIATTITKTPLVI